MGVCLGRDPAGAGGVEELPSPGSYLCVDLPASDASVIVVRGDDGKLHAMHNVCSHRLNKVVYDERGRTPKLFCQFHGWTYELDGSITRIPEERNFGRLDRAACALTKVAVDVWGGFIFGNAAAVFENSEIHIIRPGYLTAQSRTAADQSTGYVFLHARITAADLGGREFFLGRPWRSFSRVVFLDSEMPSSLSPQGWTAWSKGASLQDAFYAESGSTGPGARVDSRLAGTHQLSASEAAPFMPKQFLAGADHWNAVAEAARLP